MHQSCILSHITHAWRFFTKPLQGNLFQWLKSIIMGKVPLCLSVSNSAATWSENLEHVITYFLNDVPKNLTARLAYCKKCTYADMVGMEKLKKMMAFRALCAIAHQNSINQ